MDSQEPKEYFEFPSAGNTLAILADTWPNLDVTVFELSTRDPEELDHAV